MQVATPYLLLILLVIPAFCSARVGTQDFIAEERELFLVDPTASKSEAVSATYAALGYDEDHNSTCTYRIYGTPENTAAGDSDMLLLASYFKKRFNKVAKQVAPDSPLLITKTEVTAQKLGDVVERRRLSSDQDDRNLLFVRYSFGYLITNYVCLGCSPDNADKRRKVQATLGDRDFVEQLKNDLKKSKTKFMTTSLGSTSCLRLQCDDGEMRESDGCVNFPLE
jgi:hypothetical protein